MTKEREELLDNILLDEDNSEKTKTGEKVARVTGRIPPQNYTNLKLLANDRGMSFNELLNEVLEDYLLDYKEEIKELRFERMRANAILNNPELLTLASKKPEILQNEDDFLAALKSINN